MKDCTNGGCQCTPNQSISCEHKKTGVPKGNACQILAHFSKSFRRESKASPSSALALAEGLARRTRKAVS